ncbi:MAG: ABC transporter substrate-binding protein [Candidatus Zapsychrus exili]|nr:ABC transporter substrate-binding protein [Candidatus Zapsychrus exili]
MKRICFIIIIVLVSFCFISSVVAQEEIKMFKIGLAVLKDNPDYYDARMAFVNFLEKQEGVEFEFKDLDASGDLEAYKSGLLKFLNEDKVDLIFTTGTRSTKPAVEIVKDIPLIFTAVAAPVRSNIVETLEKPGSNVTGTHCAVPAVAQVKTILKVIPEVKRVGIIYTKGEPNAEIQTQDFIDAFKDFGLEFIASTVTKDCKTEEEVAEATRKFIGKVDIIISHQDTSISRYGKGMIDVAEKNNIPTYASLGQLLSEGAMFSLGIDFKALGELSGKQALEILKDGASPSDIPVLTDKNYSLILNLSATQKIGASVPIRVLRSASKVIR